MTVSPHELLEQGYTHFHKREFEDAFNVWSLVLDHPQATEDDRSAARECLELLERESREVLDVLVPSDDGRIVFDSAEPFRIPQMPSDEDTVPPPAKPIAPPPPAGNAEPAVAALHARLTETESLLRDARERMMQLEKMVNEANHQKRELEVKVNQAEHALLAKQAELVNANQELALVSREILSQGRELKSRDGQAAATPPPPVPSAPAPPPADMSELEHAPTIISGGAAPALFRSVDSSTRRLPPPPPSRRAEYAGTGHREAPTSGERKKLQTMLSIPTQSGGYTSSTSGSSQQTAADSSRAFTLQRMGPGSIMRTGLHPHTRPINWLALAAAVGLMVSILLPWRTGVGAPGDLMVGGLGTLADSTMPIVPTEIWRSLVELLYLLPVIGLALIVWELINWSLGYDGHGVVAIGGIVAGLMALAVFALCSPSNNDTVLSNLQWHLPYVRSGFWFAIGSASLLLVAGIAWPRARVSRHGGYGRPLPPPIPADDIDPDETLIAAGQVLPHNNLVSHN